MGLEVNKKRGNYIVLVIPIFLLIATLLVTVIFYIYQNLQTSKLHKRIQKTPFSRLSIQPSRSQQIVPRPYYEIPILLYHYVENVTDNNDTIRKSLNISPLIFEKQITTLKDAGYTFLTAEELDNVIEHKSPFFKKSVVLTFDDGHEDFDTVILPILKKHQIKATVYIITGFIGKKDFMSSSQIEDVIQSKLVEVGAHTVHHISLKQKSNSVLTAEILQSKQDLENTFNIQVSSFAYPNGFFDSNTVDVIQNNGFKTAMTTVFGIKQSFKNRLSLYRIKPGYRIGKNLLDYIENSP